METLHTYRKRINDDIVFISIYSSEVEELTAEVQKDLEYWKASNQMDVFGLIEVTARNKARTELDEQGISTSPKYLRPVTKFYSDLIKDELIRRLA